MKAIARLILAYLAGRPLQRWATSAGLVAVAYGIVELLFFPPSSNSEWVIFDRLHLLVPQAGLLILFLSGSWMPLIFGRFTLSHQIHMLPYGRVKLLMSVTLTLAFFATLFASVVSAAFWHYSVDHTSVFSKGFVNGIIVGGFMYVSIWFASRARSAVGVLGGVMLVIVAVVVPLRFVAAPRTPVRDTTVAVALVYGFSAALFLFAPRVKIAISSIVRFVSRPVDQTQGYSKGREVDLMMGTARPWRLALGQAFPIALATLFIKLEDVWLFYFALCSALSGAMASVAAERSRCLWLRGSWSRAKLFSRVEASFLRQGAYSVSVLLLLLTAIGLYRQFPIQLLALGIPLLILGTVASTYLGLMMTRGIGWLDCSWAVGTMLIMMFAAVYADGNNTQQEAVIALEAVLAIFAVVFRTVAARRWGTLDWTMCRSERAIRLAQ
jgi:hypothetical protein